jgi:anaerobic magnesium-protoporphyrin IX monomethyl ester cyclase
VRLATSESFDVVFTYYQRDPAYSLGLASLSAYAKREIPEVRVHLVPIFRDDSVEKIVGLVSHLDPALIAVSAMSPTWIPSDPYLRGVRDALPATPVLVGGYQAIVSPEETIRHPAVDYVCVGDGEEPLVGLLRRLRGLADESDPIPGLWEKRDGDRIVRRPPVLVRDLDALPFPDYSIFEREGEIRYLSPRGIQSQRLTTVPVVSGRGCPYRCTYCANTTLLEMHGGKNGLLRKHDPPSVVDGLVDLRDRYGAQYFQFWDEEFLWDLDYASRLLDDYRERVGLPFSMFARVESIDDDLCRFAAAAGCHSLWFGIESGSEEYRRRWLGRRMSNERIVAAARVAHEHGIKRFGFNMVGMPFETSADAAETLRLAKEIAPELTVFSQFLPLPGTPLHEVCRQNDLLLEPSADQQMWPLGKLNIREREGAITNAQMREMAEEIMAYLDEYNRFDA